MLIALLALGCVIEYFLLMGAVHLFNVKDKKIEELEATLAIVRDSLHKRIREVDELTKELGLLPQPRYPDRVVLNRDQFNMLVDNEARKRLNMSGHEFQRRYRAGTLPNTTAARRVGRLMLLVEGK